MDKKGNAYKTVFVLGISKALMKLNHQCLFILWYFLIKLVAKCPIADKALKSATQISFIDILLPGTKKLLCIRLQNKNKAFVASHLCLQHPMERRAVAARPDNRDSSRLSKHYLY